MRFHSTLHMHGPYVTMSQAAKELGVTYDEARRLGRIGVIVAFRTPQGWFVQLPLDDQSIGVSAPDTPVS